MRQWCVPEDERYVERRRIERGSGQYLLRPVDENARIFIKENANVNRIS